MKGSWQIHPHLAITLLASAALAGATGYFLEVASRHPGTNVTDWLPVGASWATVFVTQIGVYLTVVCPVAAHALSGRWSWSVRVFTAVSVYGGGMMAMLAVNAYEDAQKATGHIRTPAQFLESVLELASVFLFYLLLTVCTLT